MSGGKRALHCILTVCLCQSGAELHLLSNCWNKDKIQNTQRKIHKYTDGKLALLNTLHCILTACLYCRSGGKLYLLSACPLPTDQSITATKISRELEFHTQCVSSSWSRRKHCIDWYFAGQTTFYC